MRVSPKFRFCVSVIDSFIFPFVHKIGNQRNTLFYIVVFWVKTRHHFLLLFWKSNECSTTEALESGRYWPLSSGLQVGLVGLWAANTSLTWQCHRSPVGGASELGSLGTITRSRSTQQPQFSSNKDHWATFYTNLWVNSRAADEMSLLPDAARFPENRLLGSCRSFFRYHAGKRRIAKNLFKWLQTCTLHYRRSTQLHIFTFWFWIREVKFCSCSNQTCWLWCVVPSQLLEVDLNITIMTL